MKEGNTSNGHWKITEIAQHTPEGKITTDLGIHARLLEISEDRNGGPERGISRMQP